MSLLQELRRRKVLRLAALYIVGAWVVLQVADLAFESWDIASSALRYVWLGAILGFPVALVFAWRYDITTRGILRTPPADVGEHFDLSLRPTDYLILALLVAVAIGVIYPLSIQIGDSRSPQPVEFIEREFAPNSIAVLPFDNLSGDPEQAYFVAGMQDALIAGLSRISALRVTSKTSTMRYRDTIESLPRIAAQLGVAKLIEGSIFRVDNKVRITVKLVDARLDEHIWSETFEQEVKDVMLLQNEVAQAIAQQVEVAIRPEEQNQFESAESVDPAAYEAYLKGQFHVERFTPQDMKLAAQYYQQAMDLDPDHALAYAGLARLCAFQAQAGLITPQVARERCLPRIVRALDIDSSAPDAQLAYAVHMTWLLYNWEEGEAAFQRAIDLNPSFAEARMFYSHYLTLVGRIEEGTEQMRLALELDPLNPFVQSLYGMQLCMAGDLQGCIRVIEDVLASTPGVGFGHGVLVWAYHSLGEKDKAIAALTNQFRLTMNFPEGALALATAYAKGDYSHAMLQAAEALEERSKTVHVGPLAIGNLYEYAGEAEKAIDWYELGYQITGPSVPYLGVFTPPPAVRSNPRFIKLLRDIKLDYWADKYSQPGE
jgi:TolB-like protein/cytochrome c-type biogenesis protein CcmH/NrfG